MDQERIDRPLTKAEIALLETIFCGSVIYSEITVYNYDTRPKEKQDGRSHCIGNNIYLLGDDYMEDVSLTGNTRTKWTLVHEVAHVWQNQKGQCFKVGDYEFSSSREAKDSIASREIDSLYRMVDDVFLTVEGTKEAWKGEDPKEYQVYKNYYQGELDRLFAVIKAVEKRYKPDIEQYLNNHGYDPIIPELPRPLTRYQTEQTHPFSSPSLPTFMSSDTSVTTGFDGQRGGNLNIQAEDSSQPIPGERLSDFLWRDPGIRTHYKTKSRLVDEMRESAEGYDQVDPPPIEYNYMLQPPGSVDFYELRTEAQAQVISDYYLVKNGVDPRTVSRHVMLTPPPLSFYEDIIPFVPCLPQSGAASKQQRRLNRHKFRPY